MRSPLLAIPLAFLALTPLRARTPSEFPQVAPAAEVMAALLPADGARLLPSYTNRAAWAKLAKTHGLDVPKEARRAKRLLRMPLPSFPRKRFYDFTRNGDRYRFQRENGARWRRLNTLAQAELLEGKGRFLPALSETLRALCADPTWVLSAHDIGLHNVEGRTITIDLASSQHGWYVAELVACFGDALPPEARTEAIAAVRARVVDPYLAMARSGDYNNWWALSDANWNPVCHSGTVGAALALPGVTPDERALVAGSARVLVRRFLKGFSPDGWTGEGVGYWAYGFGHFAQLCEIIRRATGGREDWLLWPEAYLPALATPTSRLCGDLFPVVADANMDVSADAGLENWLGARLGFPARERPSIHGRLDFPTSFVFDPAFLPALSAKATTPTLPPRTWFPNAQIFVARTPRRCLMAMGGDNGVPHNHNDCGTFTLAIDGVPVVTDLGGEEYTSRTFSSRRYDSPLLNSFGHPVPRPADTLQASGRKAAAKTLAADFTPTRDRLTFDLAPAYPSAGLTRLTREFLWEPKNDSARLTLTDTFAFAEPKSFETALTTWGSCKRLAPDLLRFSFEGKSVELRVRASAPWHLTEETINGKPMGAKWQARVPRRVAIRLDAPAQEGFITLTAEP